MHAYVSVLGGCLSILGEVWAVQNLIFQYREMLVQYRKTLPQYRNMCLTTASSQEAIPILATRFAILNLGSYYRIMNRNICGYYVNTGC